MTAPSVALGVDVGTQGVRVLAVDVGGAVLGSAQRGWALWGGDDGVHEQEPAVWWAAVVGALGDVAAALDADQRRRVGHLALTSTSGTLLLLDDAGQPLRDAVMWDDTRATVEAVELADTDYPARTGLRPRASSPLAKLRWLSRHEPEGLRRAVSVCHASDWLLRQLGASELVTDPTNALKTGYDVQRREWVSAVQDMDLVGKLPTVVPAGSVVGELTPALADELGLPRTVRLVATMTDANTALLAAGAVHAGDAVSTLGTGLSVKVLSRSRVVDLDGGVYSHLHPTGSWIVSGTSHCGASTVGQRFGGQLESLTEAARSLAPGSALVYPLPRRGEFFPFWCPEAVAFQVGEAQGATLFRATLEGIAVNERLCFERLARLGTERTEEVRIVGGASASTLFNGIRASALNQPLRAVAQPQTAMGAAITAFAAAGEPLGDVVSRLVEPGALFEPEPALVRRYDDLRGRLVAELVTRGYLAADDSLALAS